MSILLSIHTLIVSSSLIPFINLSLQSSMSRNTNDTIQEGSLQEEGIVNDQSSHPTLALIILHNSIIILLTLFGNILLVSVVFRSNRVKRRKKITPIQLLMLHMCTADISFALLTILPNLLTTVTVPVFHGPNALCKFVKYIQVVPLYASAFLLVAISADRYNAICRPLSSIRRGVYNRPSLYATIAWTTALIFSTPQLALFYKDDLHHDCIASYTESWQYLLYVCMFNVAVWLLPSALAGSFYFCVCRAVWKSASFGRGFIRTQSTQLCDEGRDSSHHNKALSFNSSSQFDSRRLQTLKLTMTIVAVNFLLWAPFCLIQVVDAIWPSAISPLFSTYILLFGNLNSCVNPWMWFIFNRDLLRDANPFHSTTEKGTEFTLTERPATLSY